MLWPRFDADNVQHVNHDQENAEHAANHNQSPWELMGALVLFANSAQFRLCENTQRDEADGEAEADNPVEHAAVSSVSLWLCGVFAQKYGAFASSQMAR